MGIVDGCIRGANDGAELKIDGIGEHWRFPDFVGDFINRRFCGDAVTSRSERGNQTVVTDDVFSDSVIFFVELELVTGVGVGSSRNEYFDNGGDVVAGG